MLIRYSLITVLFTVGNGALWWMSFCFLSFIQITFHIGRCTLGQNFKPPPILPATQHVTFVTQFFDVILVVTTLIDLLSGSLMKTARLHSTDNVSIQFTFEYCLQKSS